MERRFQARGLARRQKLLDSARALLQDYAYAEVSFSQIAAHAAVPEGSAYHFFTNRQAIFQELARQSNEQFREAICNCQPTRGADWKQLLADQVAACLNVYRENTALQKLLPALSFEPESHSVEHEGNRQLGITWAENLRQHFEIAESIPLAEKLRLMIECVDSLISLWLVEQGELNESCLQECQRLSTAYIGLYLPAYLEQKS